MPRIRLAASGLLVLSALAACGSPTDSGGGGGGTTVGRLPGNPTAPAGPAVPDSQFQARTQDYSPHPAFGGLQLSFNTAIVTFNPAATVGGVNRLLDSLDAVVAGGVQGTAQTGGVAVLRLSTMTHPQMDAAVATLAQHSLIHSVTEDVLLDVTELPQPTTSTLPVPWTWESTPQGGNWGLELSRVPQLWNWEPALVRAGTRVSVGVIDAGFFVGNEDLSYKVDLSAGTTSTHGTHVAGIIGASYDNGMGTDGVCPVCDLVVSAPPLGLITLAQDVVTGLTPLLAADPGIRVINISLAYNWYLNSTAPLPLSAPQVNWVNSQGKVVADALVAMAASGTTLPVIVVAAGNDGITTAIPAQTATPLANAAIVHGSAPIIVVEADSLSPTNTAIGASFSNTNGVISAPGAQILSDTGDNAAYGLKSGTSMASPFVAGVVGMMYALDPTLSPPTPTTNPVRDLLLGSAVPVAGRPPRVDAYRAAVALGDSVIKRMVDIDDGSADGNLRVDTLSNPVTTDAHGDGQVDMRDFRRWRDWLLQLENAPGLALDGAGGNPKRDLNGDGIAGLPSGEAFYPRGDFNGDGLLLRNTPALVTGPFGSTQLTDLEVLQRYFKDPDYTANDLPGLLDSGDFSVNAAACLAVPGVTQVISSRTRSGQSAVLEGRDHGATAPEQVFTLPVDVVVYKLTVTALNAADSVLGVDTAAAIMHLGGDFHFAPDCKPFEITTSELPHAALGASYDFVLVTAHAPADVTWSITSGRLPSGLALMPEGNIIGETSESGPFPLTIQASSGGLTTTRQFTLTAGQDVTGTWVGTFTVNLGTGGTFSSNISVVVTQTGSDFAGSYAVDEEHFGTVTGTIAFDQVTSWTMIQQSGCPGSFGGGGTISTDGRTIDVAFDGADCHNTHSGGTAVVNRQ